MIMGNQILNTGLYNTTDQSYVNKTPTYCEKCKSFYPSDASPEILLTHLETCKTSENPSLLKTSKKSVEKEMSIPKKKIIKEGSVINGQPFIWIKKKSTADEEVWEKQRITDDIDSEELPKDKAEVAELDFETKRKWFRKGVNMRRIHFTKGAEVLKIDKEKLLESSVECFRKCVLYKEVKIIFSGEEKVNDAGGVMREWMNMIVKELAEPELGLFMRTDSDEVSYTINPKSPFDSKTLEIYEFAGKVIGKAIFERISLDIHFDYCLLAALSGNEPTLEDLRTLDTPLYNSLSFIKNNSLKDSEIFEEYFAVPNGEGQMIELCDKGATTLVTDENKDKFVQLMIDWYGKKRNQKKIIAMIQGITKCMQISKLSVFKREELEMIINGVPFIDVDDWEANTIYKIDYSRTSDLIKWFWKALKGMSQQDLSKLLKFCTGSSRTPVEGFRVLESNRGDFARFCIKSTPLTEGRAMIIADTCFNRLTIPIYKDEETLIYELNAIIQSNFDGVFGLD